MEQPVKTTAFLADVFVCALGAYGGPEAHMGVFLDQLVVRRKYLTEGELVELLALCSVLPGPTSTQTIVAVGYKTGGPWLALLTMLVWAAPAIAVMTILSFMFSFLDGVGLSRNMLRFIGPAAVGFIAVAAWKIGKKVVVDRLTAFLCLISALITWFFHTPWVFPVLLASGGMVAVAASGEKTLWKRVDLNPPWIYLFLFFCIAGASLVGAAVFPGSLVSLFEKFYRYGYLVFGGGQVVVPLMYSELVDVYRYMDNTEFLTGYGLVQGIPGPMFSFASWAGALAARSGGRALQAAGGVLGGLGIFLPGLLLIYFVYPVWERLKSIPAIRISLKGIGAVASGLVAVAAFVLAAKNGLTAVNLVATAVTIALLMTKRVPAPFIVALALLSGIFLPL